MGMLVTQGAQLSCPFGTAPGTLSGTSQTACLAGGRPAAAIQDAAAYVHITPFGMCTSLLNPQVAAATAAALGALTPQPCMPAAGAWMPVSPNILIGMTPCLSSDSKLVCLNGMGVISVTSPGQTNVIL